MNLFDQIIAAFPELSENLKAFVNGTIVLQDDLDGTGAYIREWNYSKPITTELKGFLR